MTAGRGRRIDDRARTSGAVASGPARLLISAAAAGKRSAPDAVSRTARFPLGLENRLRMRKRHLVLAAAVLTQVCAGASGAGAEVRLSGTPDRLVLQVKDASLPEILQALGSALNVEIDLAGSSSRRFTGAYSGSMRRVLARLLGASDYVIKPSRDGLHVRIVSMTAERHAAARSVAANEASARAALAAAAAGSEGSRASRIRQQRAVLQQPDEERR